MNELLGMWRQDGLGALCMWDRWMGAWVIGDQKEDKGRWRSWARLGVLGMEDGMGLEVAGAAEARVRESQLSSLWVAYGLSVFSECSGAGILYPGSSLFYVSDMHNAYMSALALS